NAATRQQGIERLQNGFTTDGGVAPWVQLLLGRAYEAAGDKPAAVRAYSRFLRAWAKADSGVQAPVVEARQAVARLTGEGQPLGR
ncbi:MAG: hypothetical protein AB7L66_11180, partial [Gemmatimonadales bacterium]